MHRKGGCCRAAAVLLLCGLTSGLSANASATAEEAVREQMGGDIIDLDPADLAAVAGPTRRLMAALTDHIKLIRAEMGALRADKVALAERVTRLEELDCSRREEEIEAKDDSASVIGCMPLPVYRPAADRNGTKRRETAAQRGSGAPRPSAAVSATDLASLVAIVSLLRTRVRRVQRGIVFVVSLARPPFRRPRLARGSSCSSKSARWATAKLGQPPRTTTIDIPAKFQRSQRALA